jgi:hypothetical protein
MRGGWSNDEESRGDGQQNEGAKISTTWLHDFPLRQKWQSAPWKLGFDRWKKIIQKPGWIAISFGRRSSAWVVSTACGGAKEIRTRDHV